MPQSPSLCPCRCLGGPSAGAPFSGSMSRHGAQAKNSEKKQIEVTEKDTIKTTTTNADKGKKRGADGAAIRIGQSPTRRPRPPCPLFSLLFFFRVCPRALWHCGATSAAVPRVNGLVSLGSRIFLAWRRCVCLRVWRRQHHGHGRHESDRAECPLFVPGRSRWTRPQKRFIVPKRLPIECLVAPTRPRAIPVRAVTPSWGGAPLIKNRRCGTNGKKKKGFFISYTQHQRSPRPAQKPKRKEQAQPQSLSLLSSCQQRSPAKAP